MPFLSCLTLIGGYEMIMEYEFRDSLKQRIYFTIKAFSEDNGISDDKNDGLKKQIDKIIDEYRISILYNLKRG